MVSLFRGLRDFVWSSSHNRRNWAIWGLLSEPLIAILSRLALFVGNPLKNQAGVSIEGWCEAVFCWFLSSGGVLWLWWLQVDTPGPLVGISFRFQRLCHVQVVGFVVSMVVAWIKPVMPGFLVWVLLRWLCCWRSRCWRSMERFRVFCLGDTKTKATPTRA